MARESLLSRWMTERTDVSEGIGWGGVWLRCGCCAVRSPWIVRAIVVVETLSTAVAGDFDWLLGFEGCARPLKPLP
jgi:hypothetical protein